MTGSAKLRLRLAARALVEWRTSIQSNDYQSILRDLLAHHQHLAAHTVASRPEILECDRQGNFLLYLAYAQSASAYSRKKDDTAFIEYSQSLLWRLGFFEMVPDYGGPPLKDTAGRYKLSETILAAIDSTNEDISLLGHQALLAITIPFESQVREQLVSRLFQIMQNEHLPFIRNIGRWIRDDGFRFLIEATITILAGMLALIFLANRVLPELFKTESLWPIPIIIACFLPFTVAFYFVERLIKGVAPTTKLTGGLLRPTPGDTKLVIWLKRIKSPYADISEALLIKAMGEIIARYRTVLYSLAIQQSVTDWLQFALDATPIARLDLIEEALYLLRLSEVKERQRSAIVEWLASVQVRTAGA